jgi:hypothetical protein
MAACTSSQLSLTCRRGGGECVCGSCVCGSGVGGWGGGRGAQGCRPGATATRGSQECNLARGLPTMPRKSLLVRSLSSTSNTRLLPGGSEEAGMNTLGGEGRVEGRVSGSQVLRRRRAGASACWGGSARQGSRLMSQQPCPGAGCTAATEGQHDGAFLSASRDWAKHGLFAQCAAAAADLTSGTTSDSGCGR